MPAVPLFILFRRFLLFHRIVFQISVRLQPVYNRQPALLIQERLSVLAAPRMVRSTFLFARLRSAGGVYLSGGLKPATETSRILIYPPLIEAEVFPTEINKKAACLRETRCLFCFLHQRKPHLHQSLLDLIPTLQYQDLLRPQS